MALLDITKTNKQHQLSNAAIKYSPDVRCLWSPTDVQHFNLQGGLTQAFPQCKCHIYTITYADEKLIQII